MQKSKDQSEQNQQDRKVKRLLARWSHQKFQTTHSKLNRDRIQCVQESNQQMKTTYSNYVLQTRKTPIAHQCKVLVVGGGPAGLSAAIASSRAGAQTMIIQKFGCFGGVITTVGMQTLGWYRYQGTNDSEGIGREMERIASKMGGSYKFPYNDSQCLDADQFKMIADDLIIQNNIKPLLHTYVVDAIVSNNLIKGVIVQSKSGRQAIYAERIIDCTGDADIAYFSGCRYTKLPLEKSLGVTSVFNVSGIDSDKFLEYAKSNPQNYSDWNTGTWKQDTTGKQDSLNSPYFGRQFKQAEKQGILDHGQKNLDIVGSWSSITQAGEATNLNLVHMTGYDTLSNEDLTKAQMQGRRGSKQALKALKKLVPGFQKAKLRNFATTIGIRDSRKIVGKYNLTGSDVCMQARFNDSIGVFPQFVDGYSILILPSSGRYFEIPYGCMVPDVDNLLVAGRCVAGDMVSHAAMRNMMCCTVTGQAAGIAAAISLKENTTTQNVNIKSLQQELQRQGARIH